MLSSKVYHDIPSTGDGVVGTNYIETSYDHDAMSRQNKTVSPDGTINRIVFNAQGQAVSTWVGTDDTDATDSDPTGNDATGNTMVMLAETEFDGGIDAGNGLRTKVTQKVNSTTADDRVTEMEYDWRNRLVKTITSDGTNTYEQVPTLDNLGRATKNESFRDDSGSPVLIAKSESFFDERGRSYRSKTYAVSDSGVAGNVLESNQWFNENGQVIKSSSPGSEAFTKTVYDAVGRATTVYSVYYDGAGTDDPESVTSNKVLTESISEYNDAGQVILSTSKDRLHDATGNGSLNGPSGSQPKSRDSYSAMWYDEVGRSVASANYGTNAGSAPTRPDSAPASSDTVLVSKTEFDIAGRSIKSTDPAGAVVKTEFDDAGRTTKVIHNFGGTDTQTVRTEYNTSGQMSKQIAENADTGNQETAYTYGVTLSNSDLASDSMLRQMTHPDGGTVVYSYDRTGQQTEMTDPNGTVHEYSYDEAGRRVADKVTTLADGVDGAVRRIEHSYDDRMRLENVTSYDAVASGNIKSDVQYEYNDFGQVTKEYQQFGAAVNVSSSPVVEYDYADGSSNTIRMLSLTYPDGRELDYGYGVAASESDLLDRVVTIKDGATTLVTYEYSGAASVVTQTYNEPGIEKTIALGSGSDPYSALDRFGRMIDLRWTKGATDLVHFEYDYDRVSNRLFERNKISTGSNPDVDSLFEYDELNRLTDFKTGLLNTAGNAISSPEMAQSFTLDETGNFKGFDQTVVDALTQTRTHNKVNEITAISETVGTAWADPAHDDAGNMIAIPKPGALDESLDAVWDGWHRMVRLSQPLDSIEGISAGMFETDIVLTANQWAGSGNTGEFGVSGTYFKPDASTQIDIGDVNDGIAADDNATGQGFIMYSAESVHTRFTVHPNNADHLIAVRLNGTQWQYSDNNTSTDWVDFTPVSTDHLIARVDFSNDVVENLGDTSVAEFGYDGLNRRSLVVNEPELAGIKLGVGDTDIVLTANQWAGSGNTGEFGVSGTSFETRDEVVNIGDVNDGVAVDDAATGTGYIMYSAEDVNTRFTVQSGNADHLVGVRLNGSQWQYNTNYAWVDFEPWPSDRLIASVDFTNDTVELIQHRHVLYSQGSQALEERLGADSDPEQQFVWNLGYVDDLVMRDRDTTSNGTLDERLYSLPDLRYSVMALANTSGTILERYKYDALGNVTVLDDLFASRSSSNFDWEFHYTGRRHDDSGLYFFRARYYSPDLGRFISRDPLGFVDGMSLYRAYFAPGHVDPNGLGDGFWEHSTKGPTGIGDFQVGFNLRVKQFMTLVGPKGKGAKAGLQTWQTNLVNSIALVVQNGKCEVATGARKILDVVNVTQGSRLITRRDEVAFEVDEASQKGDICFIYQYTKKRMGFRSNDGQFFTGRSLPQGGGYDASDIEWQLARRMSKPYLKAEVRYLFLDSDKCCCCAENFKKMVRDMSRKYTGNEWNTECEGFHYEYLKYADLGVWQYEYRE